METTTPAAPATIHLVREYYGPKTDPALAKLTNTLIDVGDGMLMRCIGGQQKHVHTVGRESLVLVPYEPVAAFSVTADGTEPIPTSEPLETSGKLADLLDDRWRQVSEGEAREFMGHLV
jgi:hypothetical protein